MFLSVPAGPFVNVDLAPAFGADHRRPVHPQRFSVLPLADGGKEGAEQPFRFCVKEQAVKDCGFPQTASVNLNGQLRLIAGRELCGAPIALSLKAKHGKGIFAVRKQHPALPVIFDHVVPAEFPVHVVH